MLTMLSTVMTPVECPPGTGAITAITSNVQGLLTELSWNELSKICCDLMAHEIGVNVGEIPPEHSSMDPNVAWCKMCKVCNVSSVQRPVSVAHLMSCHDEKR